MFKKIWKDPVGSKIIAWSIIGLIGLTSIKITSFVKGITFNEVLKIIYDFKVRIIYVLIVLFLIFIFIRVIKRKKSYYSKTQKKIMKFNKKLDEETEISYKWNVYFKTNGNPSITDLEMFCNKHNDVPLRFITNRCPVKSCENSRIRISESRIKNNIESILINNWENLNA
ncbi:hypothetical protein [Polaribacter sp. SA4-12]|uniref:hypothetical protein n=1 Tax=Polaribacter sp. SA4-12 TaxID=1312072 RepID=UPI000B3C50DC|nr:hypothetical protein [Polaribacter sp. SA4-12]ARV13961.1 hypothetical protein BTO07_01835 [Polaribacter sp. SA4-12]